MNSQLNVVLEPGITQKLQFGINRNKGTYADVEWLSTGKNFSLIALLARGEAELVLKTKPAPEPEQVIDSIIRVNRSIRPSYPDWMKEVIHPELEAVGPSEYDGAKLEQWLHDGQKDGKWIEGNKIYAHLKKTDTLKTCLGLRDLEEIQKKGIANFRKHFAGKAVFGWASVVRNRLGSLRVPYLFERGGKVVLYWHWLDDSWGRSHPALCHASDLAKSPTG